MKQIEHSGGTAVALRADVSDAGEATAVAQTIRDLSGLHVLVNNAGAAADGLIADMNLDAAWQVMRVNSAVSCTARRRRLGISWRNATDRSSTCRR